MPAFGCGRCRSRDFIEPEFADRRGVQGEAGRVGEGAHCFDVLWRSSGVLTRPDELVPLAAKASPGECPWCELAEGSIGRRQWTVSKASTRACKG